jgi:hypothetical protein
VDKKQKEKKSACDLVWKCAENTVYQAIRKSKE